jgi:hypothetical protein
MNPEFGQWQQTHAIAIKKVFGNVVAIAFQNIFHSKKHQNNIFKKIIFDINTSKWSENTKKILI